MTQAEYQLFLNELEPADRFEMVPPHWKTCCYSGEPESPLLGVWPWQARRFAAWATRGTGPASWHLPTGAEPAESPTATTAYWYFNDKLSSVPASVTEAVEAWARGQEPGATPPSTLNIAGSHSLIDCLPQGHHHTRNQTPDFNRYGTRVPTRANSLTHAISRANARARDLDLACDLAVALDHALDLSHRRRDNARLHHLAVACVRAPALDNDNSRALSTAYEFESIHALDRPLGGIFARARDRARVRNRTLTLALARDRASVLGFALILAFESEINIDFDVICSLDVGRIRAIAKSLGQQTQHDRSGASGVRRRLLGALREILTVEDDRFAARRAQLNYELCLFDLVRPHLSRDHLDRLAPIGLTLRLLLARIDGEVPPYEGILLVRDKAAP